MIKEDRNRIALRIVHLRKEISDCRVGLSLALASNDDALGKLMIKNISRRRIVLKSLEKMRSH